MDFASISVKGEKEYSSDYIKISEDGSCSCFVLADGKESPTAAKLAVNSVISDFESSGAITKLSVSNFCSRADAILKANEFPLTSCISMLLTDGSVALWGNIGDCRVYLLRDNLLYEITADHSDAYTLYEAGEIRYPKIRCQKTRYNLTKMLGTGFDTTADFSQPEIIKPNDSFLICSDGFWENIHELQIEKTLKKSTSAQNWLDRMMKIVEKNIHHKKYTRFKDTVSAITIKF